MPSCEIHHVKHKDSFRWRWQHVAADGTVKKSAESFALYYECVVAARASGYEPLLTGRPTGRLTGRLTSSPRA